MNHPGEIGFSLNRKALLELLIENLGSSNMQILGESEEIIPSILDAMQEAYAVGKQNPDIVSAIKSLDKLVQAFDPS